MAASEVEAIFGGTWCVDRSENFEAYLDAADVGYLKKKMAKSVTPKLTFKVDGEIIEVSLSAGIKTMKSSYKLGEDFDADGEFPARGNTTFTEGKLVTALTPKDSKKKPQTLIREIVDGELVQTMTVGDVTAKRIFKKV